MKRKTSVKRKPINSNRVNNESVYTAQDAITVAVRVRPLSLQEIEQGHPSCCERASHETVVIRKKSEEKIHYLKSQMGACNEYQFDHVFDQSDSQYEIYCKTAKKLIDDVLQGYNATIFAYGATGAGKTYTMLGDTLYDTAVNITSDNSGIIPNTVKDLINIVNQKRQQRDICSGSLNLSVSYFEVYNEQVYDLLDNDGKVLALREDNDGNVLAYGATEISVDDVHHVMDLLSKGNRNRKTEATQANVVSSRSHAVFQLCLNQERYSSNGSLSILSSKLSLIDLAGSERASATNNRGIRLLEGANINKSLLALANCINALSDSSVGSKHVKYRDSKLTHLLKSSLEGNCKLVMIANINPSELVYEDSHNTLKYANRAKNIKMNPEIREQLKKVDIVERETRLKEENTYLKKRVGELEALVQHLETRIQEFEKTWENAHTKDSITGRRSSLKRNSQYLCEVGIENSLNNVQQNTAPTLGVIYGNKDNFEVNSPIKKLKNDDSTENNRDSRRTKACRTQQDQEISADLFHHHEDEQEFFHKEDLLFPSESTIEKISNAAQVEEFHQMETRMQEHCHHIEEDFMECNMTSGSNVDNHNYVPRLEGKRRRRKTLLSVSPPKSPIDKNQNDSKSNKTGLFKFPNIISRYL